ncbi:cytochrome P450 [Ktedonobacteria bacterium brp13]|nr:cytochrome P450 [Ktedonobacteria bacterium brp13]
MAEETLFQQINNIAHRANPYPLYTELRKTPVLREPDGSYIVSKYRFITDLLHDPRLSSDIRTRDPEDRKARAAAASEFPVSFIRTDPPEHDRLRRMITRQFGPPHTPNLVDNMKNELAQIVNDLLDGLHTQQRTRIDIVDDFAYPFPVTVICRLLGVPSEDEVRFHAWANKIASSLDPQPQDSEENQELTTQQAVSEIGHYMKDLIVLHKQQPGEDMLSRLISDTSPDGQLSIMELISTAVTLLIAGHETTVNLQTNGMLTLLRNPEVLLRLRNEPELIVPLVEETLRFEPPVQFNSQRTAGRDIHIGGETIPKGAPVYLMLAAGNRDPERFDDPERFIPDRTDNQHLGFGNGIHYCFGAPLARLEVQTALNTLARRLINPRLVTDPPPYRPNAVLRGPRHLLIDIDGIKQ